MIFTAFQTVIKMNSCELEVKCTVPAQTWLNALQEVAEELIFYIRKNETVWD